MGQSKKIRRRLEETSRLYPEPPMPIKTMEYTRFKLLKYNREIRVDHVNKIIRENEDEFELHNFPINVNKNFEIIDGQHRFTACEKMGWPVYFIQIPKDVTTWKDVSRVNIAVKKHTLSDTLHLLLSVGNPEILRCKEIYDAYKSDKLHFETVVKLCCQFGPGGGQIREQLHTETFEIHFEDETQEILGALLDINKNFEHAYKEAFIFAIAKIYKEKKIKLTPLLKRLTELSYKLHKRTSKEDYGNHIKQVFNYGKKTKKI